MKLRTAEIQKARGLNKSGPGTVLEMPPWEATIDSVAGHRKETRSNRAFLLVSADVAFTRNLRRATHHLDHALLQTAEVGDALEHPRVASLAAILLDFDLPGHKAWIMADALLERDRCPPLILLTSRTDDSEFGTAIRAGFLVDKWSDSTRLLDVLSMVSRNPRFDTADRKATQRALLRWLKPSELIEPSYRFWGINE